MNSIITTILFIAFGILFNVEGFSFRPPQQVECTGGQELAFCGSPCTPTCDQPAPACSRICILFVCQCPFGTVQLSEDIKLCIPQDKCPKKVKDIFSEAKCPENQEYTKCATRCPPTCDNPDPMCTRDCDVNNSCQCPPGTVQQYLRNKTCIPIQECHRKPDIKGCSGGMVPTDCASKCPRTCQFRKRRFCSKDCDLNKKCECPQGFVEHNNMCVKRRDCPKYKLEREYQR